MKNDRSTVRRRAAWALVFVVALALRAGNLAAAKPYINYVDEGNFLHSVVKLLRTGSWTSDFYLYPQVPMTVVSAALRIFDPIERAFGGSALRPRLSEDPIVYDILEPFEVLAIARVVGVFLGLCVVALIGRFAWRLGGPVASLAAASLAAVTPALAIRGSIATVDVYATLFVLLSLYFTHASRTWARPGWASLGAGAMAGLAFDSKYPAVLVLFAFGVTTLLEMTSWKEKAERVALASAGLILGAAAGMPAVLLHPGNILGAIRSLSGVYASLPSAATLWHQAVVRAEWNIPYERAELGIVFLLLAGFGLALAARQRESAPTVAGWIAYAFVSLFIYSRQVFHPFRNLLPLVPLACISAGLLFARARERFRTPAGVDLAALTWVVVAFVVPLTRYGLDRMHLTDSRRAAVDWIVSNGGIGQSTVVVRELGIVKSEKERLGEGAREEWWEAVPEALSRVRPRFLIAGTLQRQGGAIDAAALPAIQRIYKLRFRAGENPTWSENGWWRGNHELVYVLERRSDPTARIPIQTSPPARTTEAQASPRPSLGP